MTPPGNGNDTLEVGHTYVISIYDQMNIVLTCCSDGLYGCTYKCYNSQLWKCTEDNDKRIIFVNKRTGKCLGRNSYGKLVCFGAPGEDEWCLELNPCPDGQGYNPIDANTWLDVIRTQGHLRYHYCGIATVIGLHRYERPDLPFKGFQWVIRDRGWLARSSAPKYNEATDLNGDHDKTQDMDDVAVRFLFKRGITNVISMNKYPLTAEERQRLATRGISYIHLPAHDARAITVEQLIQAREAYTSHMLSGRTLVYCGSGQGRTEVVTFALQLLNQAYNAYSANRIGNFVP